MQPRDPCLPWRGILGPGQAKVEQFYEDLQDLLELTPKTDVLFIIGDWNAKVGSQETPGVTGKFGLVKTHYKPQQSTQAALVWERWTDQ